MYNGQTISLKRILWAVMNNPIANELTYDQAAEWSIDAIKLIGAPLSLSKEVTVPIKLTNHKAALPTNLLTIRGIRYIWDKDLFYNDEMMSDAMTYAQDVYHYQEDCDTDLTHIGADEFTYTVQNGVITVSPREGWVQVAYDALPIDEDGYPLIPDNEKVKQALEYYILWKYLEALWTMGKITDKVFNYYEQKKMWYMGAANSSMQLSGMDHLEALGNVINRLIINTNAHKNFFKQAGKKERLKRYN
jgi:hypothetical protein